MGTRARQFEPVIPRELSDYIVGTYVQNRQNCLNEKGQYDSRKIVNTPRALLSILRLAQALARIRFSNEVSQGDVEEATRLHEVCRTSAMSSEQERADYIDVMSR